MKMFIWNEAVDGYFTKHHQPVIITETMTIEEATVILDKMYGDDKETFSKFLSDADVLSYVNFGSHFWMRIK